MRGAFWSVVGSVTARGLMLVASVFVARLLGTKGYGELGMIQSTVGMFGIFAGFGLGLTAVKHVAEFRQSDPARAGHIIGLSGLTALVTGGLMALGLFLFAPWLARHTINAPHLTGMLRVMAIMLLLSALNGAQTGALSGFEAFKRLAQVHLVVGLLSFPILVLGVYLGGLTGAVWALVINLFVSWAFHHLALRREARRYGIAFTFRQCSRELSVLWKFSLPAVLSGALVGPINWACNAVFANQPNGYVDLGIFMAMASLSLAITAVNSMIGQALLPMSITLFTQTNSPFAFVNIMLPWVIGIVSVAPILVFPELGNVLFGPQFAGEASERTLCYIMFYTLIIAYKQGIARNFVAGSYLWWSLGSNGLWGAIAIGLSYLLRSHGAEGRAAAVMWAYTLNTFLFIPFFTRRGLCPKELLLSRSSLAIWATMIFLLAVSFFLELSVLTRLSLLLGSYLFMGMNVRSLWATYVRRER